MQLLMVAKIGDGYCTKNGVNACIGYSSVLKDYMLFKHKILSSKIHCSDVYTKSNHLGYNNKGKINVLYVHCCEEANQVYSMSKLDIICNLNYFGFLMYYLDDGSFHKRAHTMNLYCNSFTTVEVTALINKIYELFPIKICKQYMDRKRDGREFPYLYIPKSTAEAISAHYLDYMQNEELLHCMLYKLGLPSQTIEKQSYLNLVE